MRVALFTNQFPSLVNTFFCRDVASLLRAGLQLELFPIYPSNKRLWSHVPDVYRADLRDRVPIYYSEPGSAIRSGAVKAFQHRSTAFPLFRSIARSGVHFGIPQLAKSAYSFALGASCARRQTRPYDHVLAYWGNYSATSAFVFQQLACKTTPFSLFLHAGVDLYRDQVFLEQKLRAAKHIIVVCDFNRRFLKLRYPKLFPEIERKIYVHHLGIDLEDYSFVRGRRHSNRVIAVGRFDHVKGFDVLIHAIAASKARGVRLRADFIGGGAELSRCKKLAAQLNVPDEIRFLGWLPPKETKERIQNASFLVHPSRGLGDAVPTVLKEALALGTPVIASDVAGIPEILDGGKCGVLVPPADADRLSQALDSMAQSETLRARYSALGRARVQKLFSLWENGQRLADLIAGSGTQPDGMTADNRCTTVTC